MKSQFFLIISFFSATSLFSNNNFTTDISQFNNNSYFITDESLLRNRDIRNPNNIKKLNIPEDVKTSLTVMRNFATQDIEYFDVKKKINHKSEENIFKFIRSFAK